MAEKEKETKVSEEEVKEETKEEVKEEVKEESKEEAEEKSPEGGHCCEKEGSSKGCCKGKKKEKKDKKDELIEELNDKLVRQMAEFENFRKRSEKEKASMFDMGAVAVLEKVLPVIDNFERGLESAGDDPFAEGMKMIYKQLTTTLEDMGVEPIKALGETFNPDFHNAVMHEDNQEAGEGEITQELQKGYKYHDSVIRFSMVKVAN